MQPLSPTHPTPVDLALPHNPDPAQEKRGQPSELELAAAHLSHAIQYLCDEQLAGRRYSPAGNRLAIQILCDAALEVARCERREPNRRSLTAVLRRAMSHLRKHHG